MKNRDKVFAKAWDAIIGIAEYNMRYIDTLPMADMQNILKTKDVRVFEMDEMDAVAARSEEEAVKYYTELTGVEINEVSEIPRDYMVWEDESMKRKCSVDSILTELWDDEPFIVFTQEY